MTRQKRFGGFTLIELMVTVAIAAVLAFVAIPSLTTYMRNAALTSAANTLLASMNAARSEAMKRGQNAMVVPANNGTDWNNGWIVFVYKFDATRTPPYVYNAAYDTIISTQSPLASYLSITANGIADPTTGSPYMMYDASGFAKSKNNVVPNATFTIKRTDVVGSDNEHSRRLKVSRTGRARVCKYDAITCNDGLN